MNRVTLAIGAACVVVTLALVTSARVVVVPGLGGLLGLTPTAFEGSPAIPKRVAATSPPRNQFMAPNGVSSIHNDAWQTDSYEVAGPLGHGTSVNSTMRLAECASVTFDSRGRIVTVCIGLGGPELVLLDADSLADIASYGLPRRLLEGRDLLGALTDFTGGGYFYLDNKDRAVVPTTTRHVQVIGLRSAGFPSRGFRLERDYDLRSVVPDGDKIVSVLPAWSGRIWFVSAGGLVGAINAATGAARAYKTGERIGNSFAVDETGGVFVVTDKALYRFDEKAATGAPRVTWRETYANSGRRKPGQTQAGSGTTPTLMRGGLVAIADNAEQMHVVVMHRGRTEAGPRTVCTEPVFGAGASATEQSLIAAGDSLVVENNYGYGGPFATLLGRTTTPGLQKIRVNAAAGDCSPVWTSSETAPSAVAKISLSAGLIYTYAKPARNSLLDAWYFTAIDACTGRTVYRRLGGTGLLYNNNFAPVSLAPDGDAYVGVLGGLLRFADSSPPAGAPASATPAC